VTAVTLQWPPASAEHLTGHQQWLEAGPAPDDTTADGDGPAVPAPPAAALTDPRLIGGVAEITALMGTQLADGAAAAEVMPVTRDATRRWLEQNVRSGQLPASAGSQLEELAAAVHDRRYGLGPLSVYLRDPQVENVDINGCDQVWANSPTQRPRCAPLSIDRLTSPATPAQRETLAGSHQRDVRSRED
jgi:hypothetical protein